MPKSTLPSRLRSDNSKGKVRVQGRDRNVVDVGKKLFAVLEVLTRNPRNPPLLQEVTQAVGFAKTTVYRLLNTMIEIGYVKQTPEGSYVLARKFFELVRPTAQHQYLVPLARPWLEQMSLRTGGTVSLAVLDQGSLLYLAVVESQDPYKFAKKPGDYYYAHATAMGKCLLAYVDEREIDAIIRDRGLPKLARNTITTGTQLLAELAKIRKEGFAVNIEENAEGVVCIGAPVWAVVGQPIAAVSISGPLVKMEGVLDAMKNEVLRVTRQLSMMLGYNPETRQQAVQAEKSAGVVLPSVTELMQ